MQSVDSAGWAQSAGIRPGYVLQSVDDISVGELDKSRFVEMLKSVRPLTLKFAREDLADKTEESSDVLTAVAEPGTARLGFQPDCMPPARKITVKSVDAGGWAESAGIRPGYVLQSVDDVSVGELDKSRFVEMLKSVRPLTLKFAREDLADKTEESSDVLTAVAEPGTARLGFQPDCVPPASRITVKSVDAGGWAESAGIRPGYVLQSVDDVSVGELDKCRFVEMLKSVRPLTLKFAREDLADKAEESSDVLTAVAEPGTARLGFQPDCVPPASRITVKSVDAGGWAEGAGIRPGYVLQSVDDVSVEQLDKSRFVEMLKSVRPLSLKFDPAKSASFSTDELASPKAPATRNHT